ncbi:MAG: hypothetical protein Q8O99_00160 [bacterium]|nr:hypothetical protein [bacterium]
METLIGQERKTNLVSRTYRSVISEQEKMLRSYLKEKNLLGEVLKTDTNALGKLIDKQLPLTDIQSRVSAKERTRL